MQNTDKLHIILKAIQNINITKSLFSGKTLPKEALDAIETYSTALNEFEWKDYIKTETEVMDDKTPEQERIARLFTKVSDQESIIMELQKKLKASEIARITSDGAFSALAKKMNSYNDAKYYKAQVQTKEELITSLQNDLDNLKNSVAKVAFPRLG